MIPLFFLTLFVSIISPLASAEGQITVGTNIVSYTGSYSLFESGTSYSLVGCSIPNADQTPGWAVRPFSIPESVSDLQQELTVTYLSNLGSGVGTADYISFSFDSYDTNYQMYGLTFDAFNFGLEYTAYIYAEMSGYHAIHVHDTDDNLAVIVGAGNAFDCCTGAISSGATPLYIANLNTSPKASEKIGYVYLEKGLYYPIRVVYGNLMANAQIHVDVLDPNGDATNKIYRMNSIGSCSLEQYAPSDFPTTTVVYTGVSTSTIFPTGSGTVILEVPGNYETTTLTVYNQGLLSATTDFALLKVNDSTVVLEEIFDYLTVATTSYYFFDAQEAGIDVAYDSNHSPYLVSVVGTTVAEMDFITDLNVDGLSYIFDPPAKDAPLGTATIVLGDHVHFVDEPFLDTMTTTMYEFGLIADEYYILAFTHSGNYSTLYYDQSSTLDTYVMLQDYSIELLEYVPRPTTTVTTARPDVTANTTILFTPAANVNNEKVTEYDIYPGTASIDSILSNTSSQLVSTKYGNFSTFALLNLTSISLDTSESTVITSSSSSSSLTTTLSSQTLYATPTGSTTYEISGFTETSTVTIFWGAEEVVEIPKTFTFHEPIFPGYFTAAQTLTTYYSNFPLVIEYDQPVVTISYDGTTVSYSTYYPNDIFQEFEVYEFHPTAIATANASVVTNSISDNIDAATSITELSDSVLSSDITASDKKGIPGLGDINIPLTAVDHSTVQVSEIMAAASKLEAEMSLQVASESAAVASIKSLADTQNLATKIASVYASAQGSNQNAVASFVSANAGNVATQTGSVTIDSNYPVADSSNLADNVAGTVTADNGNSAETNAAIIAAEQAAASASELLAAESQAYVEAYGSIKTTKGSASTAASQNAASVVTSAGQTVVTEGAVASAVYSDSVIIDSKYATDIKPAYAFTFHAAPQYETLITSSVLLSENHTVLDGIVRTYDVVTSFSVVLKADAATASQSTKSHKGDAAGQHVVGSSLIYGLILMLLPLV